MAFFDNIGKSVNSATQGAIQKTKDVADIAKLSAHISELKGKLVKAYQAIGESYYQLHMDTSEPELVGMASGITIIKEEIANCERQIQLLKGMFPCLQCGQMLSKGVAFCNNCGARIIPDDSTCCVDCKAVIPKGTRFCISCGAAQPVVQAQTKVVVVCKQCGAPLAADDMFCNNCGAKVDVSQENTIAGPKCPSCGSEIVPGTAFCLKCGTAIEGR